MCGENWLAIKDSLTHRPSSQGWASRCSHCLSMFVVYVCLYGMLGRGWGTVSRCGIDYLSFFSFAGVLCTCTFTNKITTRCGYYIRMWASQYGHCYCKLNPHC